MLNALSHFQTFSAPFIQKNVTMAANKGGGG